MTRYAEHTTVDSGSSRAEIERTLRRYGADQFMYGWDQNKAVIGFRAHERFIRFHLPLPNMSDFRYTPERRYERSPAQIEREYEQAVRQRWRALALAVKAKLEAVEAGIATFEDEFLSYIVLPNGDTVGRWMGPQIEEAYGTGLMPQELMALPAKPD